MRIAQVAPPFESVPPARYGGTERVVATLTEELVRRGHDVTLFASADSQTSARLVPVLEQALWNQKPPYTDFGPFWSIVLGQLVPRIDEFDVVHSHLDYYGYPLARMAPCPLVTTHHGRLDRREMQPLHNEFSDVPLVSISDAQRQPILNANWVATVYHGIELGEFTFNPKRGDYLAFLGRISPEKGVDMAIRVARRAGLPIKIAARKPLPYKQDPDVRRDWAYYEDEVQPLLQGRHVELIGQVSGEEKDEFLGKAAALVFPIQWPEPFGLVMVEALACGTPVLAMNNGSVPEVLEHGVTGFICKTEEELVEAVGHIDEIDRGRCRAEAETRFSPAQMANRYEDVYERLIRRHRDPAASTGRPVGDAPGLSPSSRREAAHA
jgi:glycosyltransferase involved in cell wall biosynthesis